MLRKYITAFCALVWVVASCSTPDESSLRNQQKPGLKKKPTVTLGWQVTFKAGHKKGCGPCGISWACPVTYYGPGACIIGWHVPCTGEGSECDHSFGLGLSIAEEDKGKVNEVFQAVVKFSSWERDSFSFPGRSVYNEVEGIYYNWDPQLALLEDSIFVVDMNSSSFPIFPVADTIAW